MVASHERETTRVFRALLISVVIVPVLLGIVAARRRREQEGVAWLVALVLAYDLFFMVLLYYVHRRWVG
jgi:hypothetical protein